MRNDEELYMQELLSFGDGAPGTRDKLRILQELRQRAGEEALGVDLHLLACLEKMHRGLVEARERQGELKAVLEKLSADPWYPAVFLDGVAMEDGPRALVACNGSRRVVGLAEGVEADSLSPGDEVLLGQGQNVVMMRSLYGLERFGETATFERLTPDGRLVLKWRDEDVVVEAAAALRGADLSRGDLLRWDRYAWMAFEKLERPDGRHHFLEETPDVGPESVGGQAEALGRLLDALTAALVAPDKARSYRLKPQRSILMWGPPGCGKTLMARVAAAEVARLSKQQCRFAVVKPAEWENPYVGATQQNIRNCFAALAEAAEDGFVVLFMDEIEAVGRIRGGLGTHHSDKFLAALLAELDGFRQRKGVAVIAASNRKDLIDPALLERISDMDLHVGRPDMRGARAILHIHMPDAVPYSPNGKAAEETRREMIEAAVSRLYSPNADNELCLLRFRDSTQRRVAARELVSGRLLEQVSTDARHRACLRDIRTGEEGVRLEDMESALDCAMERLASALTVRNVHAYLTQLPHDVDVVAVEPIERKVKRPHRYLNLRPADEEA